MTDESEDIGQEEALTEEQLDKDHIWVKLTKPINAYGEEVSVIKMRIPTAADSIRVGNPVDFGAFAEPPTVRFIMPILRDMVARLANIPGGSIEKMAPNDLISCGWKLAPLFFPNLGT